MLGPSPSKIVLLQDMGFPTRHCDVHALICVYRHVMMYDTFVHVMHAPLMEQCLLCLITSKEVTTSSTAKTFSIDPASQYSGAL